MLEQKEFDESKENILMKNFITLGRLYSISTQIQKPIYSLRLLSLEFFFKK